MLLALIYASDDEHKDNCDENHGSDDSQSHDALHIKPLFVFIGQGNGKLFLLLIS